MVPSNNHHYPVRRTNKIESQTTKKQQKMAPNIRPTLNRKDSNASEDDFFDIPDEPLLAILKRQLRHVRTWVVFALILLYLFWPKSDPPPYQAAPRQSHVDYDLVDWSRYGYTVYATSSAYICNALMVFEALDRLGSRARRVLFYPEQWDVFMESDRGRDESLLVMATERYGVQLVPVDAQMMRGGGGMFHLFAFFNSSFSFSYFGKISRQS